MRERRGYSAPALEKGLDILELLAAEEGGLPLNEIARRLERTPSEIFRMLEVLAQRGYLKRGEIDGRFRLTLRLFELAHRHPPLDRLLQEALPAMRQLAETAGQSIHLSVHHDRRIVVVAQADGFSTMGFSVRLGSTYPFRGDRVSAWVLTAFQAPDRQAGLTALMLEGEAPRAQARILRQIEETRRAGFVLAPSATVSGVTDICFPVRDASGGAVAALVVAFLEMRDSPATLEAARRQAGETALRISAGLGYNPERERQDQGGEHHGHRSATRGGRTAHPR